MQSCSLPGRRRELVDEGEWPQPFRLVCRARGYSVRPSLVESILIAPGPPTSQGHVLAPAMLPWRRSRLNGRASTRCSARAGPATGGSRFFSGGGQRPFFQSQFPGHLIRARLFVCPLQPGWRRKLSRPQTVEILKALFVAHRISFTSKAGAPEITVVAQSYYHCWCATVDGQPVPIWQANHAFQAIPVPQGDP